MWLTLWLGEFQEDEVLEEIPIPCNSPLCWKDSTNTINLLVKREHVHWKLWFLWGRQQESFAGWAPEGNLKQWLQLVQLAEQPRLAKEASETWQTCGGRCTSQPAVHYHLHVHTILLVLGEELWRSNALLSWIAPGLAVEKTLSHLFVLLTCTGKGFRWSITAFHISGCGNPFIFYFYFLGDLHFFFYIITCWSNKQRSLFLLLAAEFKLQKRCQKSNLVNPHSRIKNYYLIKSICQLEGGIQYEKSKQEVTILDK